MYLRLPRKTGDRELGVTLTEMPNRRNIHIVKSARCEEFVFGLGKRGAVYVLQGRMHQHSLESNSRVIRRCTTVLMLLGVVSEEDGLAAIKFAEARQEIQERRMAAHGFISDAETMGIILTKAQLKKVNSV
tara:strand:+ start:750 stop:1142 length:393 start_codon:yes stop_codon:yes gene_type:complete